MNFDCASSLGFENDDFLLLTDDVRISSTDLLFVNIGAVFFCLDPIVIGEADCAVREVDW